MQANLVAKTFIVNNHDELLVLRRYAGDSHRPGQWDLPGGQVEPGEDPQQAAVREAHEETQLQIDNLRPVHISSQVYGTTHVVKTVFATTSYCGDLQLSWEHSEAMWVSRDAFDDLTISASYKDAAKQLQPAAMAA